MASAAEAVGGWRERVRAARERRDALAAQLADPAVLGDPERLKKLAREHAELEALAEAGARLEKLEGERAQAREVIGTETDAEFVALAESEIEALDAQIAELEERCRELVVPKDPLDDRDAVVEIRAGTGGDEAALFAAELFRMYARYAETRGWSVEVLSRHEGALGGLKEVTFVVRGPDVYGALRSESGVHRVQRVPVTESQGRIHTSAATVAVLPEAEEVDVEIKPDEIRIDVFRASGPGGQGVNTADSAVRITHVPSGMVVSCQDERSQLKNKQKALKILRSRLLDLKVAEKEAERARERRLQVGTGDRSAKIRTYNFPQNRVTDHRIELSVHRLEEVLEGDLDELLAPLKEARQQERISA